MNFRRIAVTYVLKGIFNTICKIDCREYVEALSKNSPMIVAINHTNFLEVPILITHSYPCFVTGLAKSGTWKNPLFAFIFNTYHAIPLDRGHAFHEAFKKVRKTIDRGFFVIIAPEGTRSKDGILRQGKAGIIHLALDTDVPVLPVVHYGGENIWKNMRRLRRTPFCFRAGRPFRIKFDGRPDKEVREEMLDEVMGQMARLLPPEKRGTYAEYAERAAYECKYLEFL
ncbi:MAG: 1-acyl-sn-glycerol-3-phosphate acyltransferase [Treponema sp.]|nr:1-acyl-sn-glycerol-3-phosphate acyltransferase [Treponema sp.]